MSLTEEIQDFDSDRFFLGNACKRNHLFDEKHCLRYQSSKHCVECCKIQRLSIKTKQKRYEFYCKNKERLNQVSKDYYQKNKTERNAKAREYKRNHRERVNAVQREYNHIHKEKIAERCRRDRQNPEKITREKQRRREYYLAHRTEILAKQKLTKRNPESRRISCKKYAMSAKGKLSSARRIHRRRIQKANNHVFAYSSEQLSTHLQLFGNKCVYCGSNDRKITLDHFIPVSQGGADVLSNIVACCQSCNSSKRNRDAKDWYEKQAFYSKERWKKILQVLGKTEVTLNQLTLF